MAAIPWAERWSYTAPDGKLYDLSVPASVGRWVMSDDGTGLPEIDYITERGPAQHGATVTDFFLLPRVVQLLVRQQACNRDGYWANRAALLNGLRPNRQLTPGGVQPGVLRLRRGDGTVRCLDVFLTAGPKFEPRSLGQWDEFGFQEVLRFTAFNPVLYDPTSRQYVFAQVEEQLVFPVTFPIVFGGINAVGALTYAGTWLEYPTITITGPIEQPVISNLTTGEEIALDYDVPAGVVVTITLTYGNKTVRDSLGNNLIGVVTPESELATWHLAPDPEAPDGVNTISVSGTGTNLNSAIALDWRARYIGM